MSPASVVFGLSADGRTVAEALVADVIQAESLLAAGRRAGSQLAWAHSAADLSPLGFRGTCGYRRLEGRSAGAMIPGHGQDGVIAGQDVVLLSADEESAELWAEAFSGQWGHKTPAEWPLDLPPGAVTLGLRRGGQTIGVCRTEPASGLVDAPGLVPAYRDAASYQALLEAALAAVRTSSVTVESWGDGPDRVEVCERLGLTTAEYVPGWEFDLRS